MAIYCIWKCNIEYNIIDDLRNGNDANTQVINQFGSAINFPSNILDVTQFSLLIFAQHKYYTCDA